MGAFNNWLGGWLRLMILVLIAFNLIEAGLRYGFDAPTAWSVDLGKFIFGGYFLFGGAYTLLHDKHVRMDAIYSRWSPRRRAIVDAATFVFMAVYLVVFIWGGIESTEFALRTGFHSMSLWGPPLAPIRAVTTVGAVLLLLQGLAMLFKDILLIRGRSQQ
jgi:TRAP-type mannitol/chloroaromatic compound transport system permease small subunit